MSPAEDGESLHHSENTGLAPRRGGRRRDRPRDRVLPRTRRPGQGCPHLSPPVSSTSASGSRETHQCRRLASHPKGQPALWHSASSQPSARLEQNAETAEPSGNVRQRRGQGSRSCTYCPPASTTPRCHPKPSTLSGEQDPDSSEHLGCQASVADGPGHCALPRRNRATGQGQLSRDFTSKTRIKGEHCNCSHRKNLWVSVREG